MALDTLTILNAIRSNASQTYMERVPEVTRENLKQVGDAITSDENIMNEYLNGLVNKVAFQHVCSKLFKNPLAILKKKGVPMGSAIEEIFINPATDSGYSKDQKRLLQTTKPDGKVAYYGLNRQSTYPVTINEFDLRRGFTSEDEFMGLYNRIISSLYSGDNIDEFNLMKGLVGKAVDENAIQTVGCSLKNPKDLSKTMSAFSKLFAFPSTEFAGYNLVNKDKFGDGEKPCITFTPEDSQVLLLRADVETEVTYEVLARMFHMELAELKAKTILVDNFPCESANVYGALFDTETIQVRDMVLKVTSQQVGNTLEWNFWLHHWQYLFLSMFGNAVAFVEDEKASGDNTISNAGAVAIDEK